CAWPGARSDKIQRTAARLRARRQQRAASGSAGHRKARGRFEIMPKLGVNIDHVATLRQARRTYEPDPVWAAAEAELGGADQITVHLREDRRHISDRDVRALKETVQCKLHLEMSLVGEIVGIAVRTEPDQATLVPEQ